MNALKTIHPEREKFVALRKMMSRFEDAVSILITKNPEEYTLDDLQTLMMLSIFRETRNIDANTYRGAEFLSLLVISDDERDYDTMKQECTNHAELGNAAIREYILFGRDTYQEAIQCYTAMITESEKEEQREFYQSLIQSLDLCVPILRRFHQEMMRPSLVRTN